MTVDVAAYQFVDTNILVYAHDASAGRKHEVSKALVKELWASRKGCLSIQVLQELYVAITQKIARPLDRGMQPRGQLLIFLFGESIPQKWVTSLLPLRSSRVLEPLSGMP